ncbi:MAG: hypothetical protein KAU22_12090 [Desulfuromonadales bacterium]|nr:hypothetical protein [Desulfuromonadales bacterium]
MTSHRYQQIESIEVPLILQQGAAIIDIRRSEEWQQTGIVAGSKLLTFFAADRSSQPKEWLRQLNQLVPEEQQLLLI